MPADASLLSARQLQCVQQASTALDFELDRGRIVALVGPHDSGKSAWLQTLAGLRSPIAGELWLLGEQAAHLSPRARQALRARLGFVSNGAPLLSNFNARLNVMLPRLYHRRESLAVAEMAANALLDQLEYHGPRDALPAHLGQLERLQLLLARALVMDPAMLFLDEPFSLDLAQSWQALGELLVQVAREEQRGVVVVTHNLFFVAEHADEILFVHNGDIDSFQGWQELLQSNRVDVQEFLHSVPIKPGKTAS